MSFPFKRCSIQNIFFSNFDRLAAKFWFRFCQTQSVDYLLDKKSSHFNFSLPMMHWMQVLKLNPIPIFFLVEIPVFFLQLQGPHRACHLFLYTCILMIMIYIFFLERRSGVTTGCVDRWLLFPMWISIWLNVLFSMLWQEMDMMLGCWFIK